MSTIPTQLDLRVHDVVAENEIELFADVLAAVAHRDGPLSDHEIDKALGLRRAS